MNSALHPYPLPSLPAGWLSATVRTQADADRLIPEMLAKSAEGYRVVTVPKERIDLTDLANGMNLLATVAVSPDSDGMPIFRDCRAQIGQVIAFGESDPIHPDWLRLLRDDCEKTGVPFWFLGWGRYLPISEMPDNGSDRYYKSVRKAKPGEDQGVLDENYGRRCSVETGVIRFDGAYGTVENGGPWLFQTINGHCSYQVFRVGPAHSGRLLDGREHRGPIAEVEDGGPEVLGRKEVSK